MKDTLARRYAQEVFSASDENVTRAMYISRSCRVNSTFNPRHSGHASSYSPVSVHIGNDPTPSHHSHGVLGRSRKFRIVIQSSGVANLGIG